MSNTGVYDGKLVVSGTLAVSGTTASQVATFAGPDSAATLTAAQIINSVITVATAGAGRTYTTPTAALLVAAVPNCAVGSGFWFHICNSGGNTITLAAGAGVTLVGTMTVATTTSRPFWARITNVGAGTEAVSIYSVGIGASF